MHKVGKLKLTKGAKHVLIERKMLEVLNHVMIKFLQGVISRHRYNI